MNLPEPISLKKPGRSELNLYLFMGQVAGELGELEHEVLQHVVAAGTARGWFPTVPQLVTRFSEHEKPEAVSAAIEKLVACRLIDAAADGRVLSTISGITHSRTPYRATSDGGVAFHLVSALDVLTIAPTLQRPVSVTGPCAQTGVPLAIEFDATGDIVSCTPRSLTAFIPGWDGQAPLGPTLARGGWFANDAALDAWLLAQGNPDGTPLTEDTLRLVGLEMAGALAARYVAVSVHGHH